MSCIYIRIGGEFGPRGSYQGDLIDGIPNGKGSSVTEKGVRYTGSWKDGKYHGKGVVTLPTGEQYNGNFDMGRRHGSGVVTKDGMTIIYTFHYGLMMKPDVKQAIQQCSKH